MTSFVGFPAGKVRFTSIPDVFFSELVPQIDTLAELKLILHMFWAINHQTGYPRYVTVAELESEESLMTGLVANGGHEAASAPLRDAIESALARGVLIRLSMTLSTGKVEYLFLNTAEARKAVAEVQAGELVLDEPGKASELPLVTEFPGIFGLFEQNLGLIPPILAEELAEAARTYPPDWIADAFRIAAQQNVRKWRYVRSILERWQHDGKDDGQPIARHRARRAP